MCCFFEPMDFVARACSILGDYPDIDYVKSRLNHKICKDIEEEYCRHCYGTIDDELFLTIYLIKHRQKFGKDFEAI